MSSNAQLSLSRPSKDSSDNLPYEKVGKNDPVCIADEVPFEIPDSWEWVRLGRIISIFGRIGFRGYTKNDMVDKGKGAITISPSNIKGMDTNFTDNSYISWAKYEESPEIMIFEDDLLLVKTGSSYGKCGIVKNLPEKATINPQLVVLKYVLINRMYLLYVLNSPIARKQYEEFVIGTSIPTFSQEKLSSLLIPLPPLDEQERITCKIQELNECLVKYDNAENALNNLQLSFPEALKKSILQQAVMGKLVSQDPNDEPASVLLERIRAEKQALIKAGNLKKDKHESTIYRRDNSHYEKCGTDEVCIDDDLPFDIPASWSWSRISDMCYFQEGPGILGKDFRTSGVPLIRIAGMQTDRVTLNGCNFLDSDMVATKWHHFRLDKGDIVISTSASLDKIAEVDEEAEGAIPYTGLIRFKMYGGILKEYFMLFIKSPCYINQIAEQEAGAAIKHYGPTHLRKMVIPIPPINEQRRIIDKVKSLTNQISAL